jgi:predicted NBD/HSP70 family sugar kinase
VASVCNILNPGRVVVGGSVGQAGELLLAEMRESVRRRAVLSAAEDVEIVAGVLGERAEVLGAVALILGDVDHPAVAKGGVRALPT